MHNFMKQESNFKSHLYCFITILAWSTLEVSGKLLSPDVTPYAITAWRFLIGGLLLLPFALKPSAEHEKPGLKGILHLGFLGFFNVCLSMLILQLSVYYGKASVSAIILSINPLFVAIFAGLILKEKLDKTDIIALIVGILGILVLVLGEVEMDDSKYRNLPLGVLLAIVAALNFGLYTVLTKSAVQRYGNIRTNAISFLLGSASLFAYNFISGKDSLISFSLSNFAVTAYMGLFITGIAYLLYFEGMKNIGASKASMYFFLKPMFATFLAWLLLGESLQGIQVVAVMLIVLAMLIPRFSTFRLKSKKSLD